MKPVRVLSANLHTTSRAPLVVPWLWAQAARHRVDVMTLQEVTPRHAFWLRKRPGWVLVQARPFTEAVYARRRLATARDVLRPVSGGWARHHQPGEHPGRSLPLATVRGWLRVGSIHFPPAWLDGPRDRQAAGHAMADNLMEGLPRSVPMLLDGDWNARAEELGWLRVALGLPELRGYRIVHAAARRAKLGRLRNLGRARGMDHDAHLIVVEAKP